MTLLDVHPDEAAPRASADRSSERPIAPHLARPAHPTLDALKRLLRSSLVGIVATAVTLVILTGCSRFLGMNVLVANAIAVAVGTTVQFVGSRYYSFRATQGAIGRQVRWFIPVEIGAYLLTNVVFYLLVRLLDLNREIANMASGFVVYFGFSYPMWHWVFKTPPPASGPPGDGGTDERPPREDDDAHDGGAARLSDVA